MSWQAGTRSEGLRYREPHGKSSDIIKLSAQVLGRAVDVGTVIVSSD